jgi:dTDP-4-dehydrorhamnose 3,5-epimerase
MNFTATAIPDVMLVTPEAHADGRGFFMETYRADAFAQAGIHVTFVQDNHSRSAQGVLRGLHYQIRSPQGKLVRVVSGEVFDVAVDLRSSSPTFGRWVGEHLSDDNIRMLWIPPGFAHGFYVLSDRAEVIYKVTDYYAPEWDRTLIWDDPRLAIQWPLVDGKPPTLSSKDARGLRLEKLETFDEMG